MINTFSTDGNLSKLDRKNFQKQVEGKNTDLYILRNQNGMEVAVTNFGCALLSIMVPDKNGKYANVLLGHDSIDHVINSPEPFLSTVIGRYGNRIAKGKFTLDELCKIAHCMGAEFNCSFDFPDGTQITVRGECEGIIALEKKGNGGFGYDPVFLVGDKSFGEISEKFSQDLNKYRI